MIIKLKGGCQKQPPVMDSRLNPSYYFTKGRHEGCSMAIVTDGILYPEKYPTLDNGPPPFSC